MLELLFPQRCAVCRRPGAQLCGACAEALRRIPPPWCERCGAPTAWPVRRCGECAGRRLSFASARAAVIYDAQAKLLIRSWKERGVRGLSSVAADVVAEHGCAARRRCDRVRSTRRRPEPRPRPSSGGSARGCARQALGAPGHLRAAAYEGGGTPGGAPARGEADEPPRRLRRDEGRPEPHLSRGRRLYERRHGARGRISAAQRRRAHSLGGDVRAGRSVDSAGVPIHSRRRDAA